MTKVVERHPGPWIGEDVELAQACAIAAIKDYGNDDPVTHQRILKNGVWNDHVAVQAALATIHNLRKAGLRSSNEEFEEYPYDDDRFNRGVQHVVDLLAKTIGAQNWTAGDGSEDYDCDLGQTLLNILEAKGLYDSETATYAQLSDTHQPEPK
ncbi:hypothetical protein QWJ07_31380 [Frankia sp. RB7]|nr:hypothetical protein [Frankia sp. RB7]